MKKIIYVLLSIIFVSCVSMPCIPKEKEYSVLPEQKVDYKINLGSVIVTKDSVIEHDLSSQVQEMAKTMFMDLSSKQTDDILYLQIGLKQRTYYKGIKQKNSIYFVYSLIDSTDKTMLNNSYTLVTSDSIDSSRLEYELLDHMNSKIRKYLNKCKDLKLNEKK